MKTITKSTLSLFVAMVAFGFANAQNNCYEESFTSSIGSFTIEDKTLPEGGTYVWKHETYQNDGYMKGSAFISGAAKASESWLVSPEFNLTGFTTASFSFDHALNHANGNLDLNTVKVFDGTNWNNVTFTQASGNNWTFTNSGNIDLAAYVNKTIKIAFVYTSTNEVAPTWKVKNFSICGDGTFEQGGNEGGEGEGEWIETNSGEGKATVYKRDTLIKMVDPNVTASSEKIKYDFSTHGWQNAEDVTIVTLADGTTLNFAKEGGNNAPKYYDFGSNVRMYALNSMTVSSSKAIAEIFIECGTDKGKYCVGNDLLYTEINGNTWKMVNDHTQNNGGVQIRLKTIEITYASATGSAIQNNEASSIRFDGQTIYNPENANIVVYSLVGTIVAEGNTDIDMSNQNSGIYIVRAGKSVTKIVKQ